LPDQLQHIQLHLPPSSFSRSDTFYIHTAVKQYTASLAI